MPPRISVLERGLDSSRSSLLAPNFYSQHGQIPERFLVPTDHPGVEQLKVTNRDFKFESAMKTSFGKLEVSLLPIPNAGWVAEIDYELSSAS